MERSLTVRRQNVDHMDRVTDVVETSSEKIKQVVELKVALEEEREKVALAEDKAEAAENQRLRQVAQLEAEIQRLKAQVAAASNVGAPGSVPSPQVRPLAA